MTNQNSGKSIHKASKIAGLTYIIIIILGVLKVNFLEPGIIVSGNNAQTAHNILANELLFRTGIIIEIFMFILVLFLSLALYVILKTVNKNLALTALFLRFGEGIVGVLVTILSSIIPLLILSTESTSEELQSLVGIFLNIRTAGLDFILIFIGFGGTIFCYLFLKSKYIPEILAYWGIFTYLSMLILSLISILFPNHPEIIVTILYSVGGLFEVIFGFWLLFKGVKLPEIKKVTN